MCFENKVRYFCVYLAIYYILYLHGILYYYVTYFCVNIEPEYHSNNIIYYILLYLSMYIITHVLCSHYLYCQSLSLSKYMIFMYVSLLHWRPTGDLRIIDPSLLQLSYKQAHKILFIFIHSFDCIHVLYCMYVRMQGCTFYSTARHCRVSSRSD